MLLNTFGGDDMVYTFDEIKSIITPIAIKYKLKAVYIFGSYARGSANEDSDIDFLVDTTGADLDTLFKLGPLYDEVSDAFSKEIDMIILSSFDEPASRDSEIIFRENVMRERKKVYDVA